MSIFAILIPILVLIGVNIEIKFGKLEYIRWTKHLFFRFIQSIRNQYCSDREIGDAIYKKSNETINGYLTLLIAENRRIICNFAAVNEEEHWNIRECKKGHISIFRKSSRWNPSKYRLSTQPHADHRTSLQNEENRWKSNIFSDFIFGVISEK